MDENKSKALAAALSQIEKQFGKGSIMRLGDTDVAGDVQAVSTGSLGLDLALGIGEVGLMSWLPRAWTASLIRHSFPSSWTRYIGWCLAP